MSNPTVVSLFTGCGGLDYGFAQAGFQILFANDFNRSACETYQHNFQDSSHLVCGDINDLIKNIPNNADLMIGGAPCQSWSMMGNRKGVEDKRGRGLLIFKTVEIFGLKKPRFFMMENVKGLLSHDNGNSFKSLLSAIENVGYDVHWHLFNMSEYGIPQRRERVIIWGKRRDETLDLTKLIPPKTFNRAEKLGDLLRSIQGQWPNSNENTGGNSKLQFGRILRPGENLAHISDQEIALRFAQRNVKDAPSRIKGFRPLYRLSPYEVAPTMVFNNGTNIPWHPWLDRQLSVREAATVQGFPLTFEFKGNLQEQYKQVANAVPPTFSIQLAQMFLNQLQGEK